MRRSIPFRVTRFCFWLLVSFAVVGGPASAAPFPWEYDLTQELFSLPTNHSPAPYVADWNDDGIDDLLVGFRQSDQHDGIGVAVSNADGSLQPLTSVFATGNASSLVGFTRYFRPVLIDWNADGLRDLVFGQYYGSKGVIVCINTGSNAAPVFHGASCEQLRTAGGSLVGETTGSVAAYVSPEVVDWDNDGDLDLLVGTGATAAEKGIRLYENTAGPGSDPVLAEPIMIVSKASTGGLAFENYYEPDVLDINGDGAKDLMIGGSRLGSTQQFVLRQCLNVGTDAAPAFSSCSYLLLPGLVNNVIDFHDWDGDGYVDLLRGFLSGFITNPVTLYYGASPDSDGDGIGDSRDSCPDVFNPADMMLDRDNPVQIDTDADGSGDPCDPDDDGDGVDDVDDNCPLASNADQSDRDADGSGDVCDPKDDRTDQPGVGSHEWWMANAIAWGRRPAILLRADAMSLGYRQEIAEALTDEALSRGLAFTLAVIPWNVERYAGTAAAAYLSGKVSDPNFEAAQHGTYHTCVYTSFPAPSVEEFDCWMDASRSFNLMRVGNQSMTGVADFGSASHALGGFIPPADAFDAAALEAARSLSYHYVSSAWWREAPDFVHVDEHGLVHLPWSQVACGNGAASWVDCQTTNLDAHSGVDCADEAVCKPTRDGKDYSDWEQYARNDLAARCRGDFARYGVCSILFELTSYDADFSQGVLDPVAFVGYQRTLDDLQALAAAESAVFMTLGEYAAAQLIDDSQPPSIVIASPTAGVYGHAGQVVVDFAVDDDLSGVWSTLAAIDGAAVEDGDVIELLALSLGQHRLVVRSEDAAGNVAEAEVIFVVEATIDSLRAAVQQLAQAGEIAPESEQPLLATVGAAEAAIARGDLRPARGALRAFTAQLNALEGKKLSPAAAALLATDAAAVEQGLE
jgi:hypothetical protein